LVNAGRTWWSVAVAVAVALVLLLGSFTIGGAAVGHRLARPEHPLGFAENLLQLAGEVTAAVAGTVYLTGRSSRRGPQVRGESGTPD
jgi:hypothetical protein